MNHESKSSFQCHVKGETDLEFTTPNGSEGFYFLAKGYHSRFQILFFGGGEGENQDKKTKER